MRTSAPDAAARGGTPLIAVSGNPNTGKTTLFNRLTGSRQRVGNYPGITVEKIAGTMRVGPTTITVIDLPGTYSLAPASADEQVVIDVLGGRSPGTPKPDAVLCVVNATSLRRNLFLVSQIAETGVPIVVALNMIDAARERGLSIDVPLLAERLGVPVIPTVASQGVGIEDLGRAVHEAIERRPTLVPVPWPEPVVEAMNTIRNAFTTTTGGTLSDAESSRLLFDLDSDLPTHLGWGETSRPVLAAARDSLHRSNINPVRVEAELRYAHLDRMLAGVLSQVAPPRELLSDRVDAVLTHRVFGLLVFVALMFLVFASIYWLAQPLMDHIDVAFGTLGRWAGHALVGAPVLESLVADGVIAGVGGVMVFLPQILILFLFIAILEDSGYMARAAFLMDKALSWCGLNGKSFVPMLSSFACAVPSLMSTRTIEDPKARLTTILIAPLMSCSARLPIYVLMIGAFIEPIHGALWAGAALFAMHLLGLGVAIPVAMVLNRHIIHGRRLPFVLEMPPYRLPRPRDVLWRIYRNGREFVARAGTIILVFSILIWALTYFPRPASVRAEIALQVAADLDLEVEEADRLLDGPLAHRLRAAHLESSYLGRAGKAVQPLFALAGFDWKLTVGVLASFPAREIVVSTLGIIYNLEGGNGGESEPETALRAKLAAATWPDGRPVYTPVVAVAVMVFFAFCLQCASTVATIAREAGWPWAAFAFGYMSALAWVSAVAVYQVGTAIWGGAG